MMTLLKTIASKLYRFLIRVLAFTAKENRIILHQPRLIFSLILGPFLILLIFGLGYRQTTRTRDTLFVVPEGSQMAEEIQNYAADLPDNINFMGVTSDPDEANAKLQNREIDLVIVSPRDPAADWQDNSQSVFTLYHNEIDPLEEAYVHVLGQRSIDKLNQLVLLEVAEQAKAEAAGYQEDVQDAQEQATAIRRALEEGGGSDVETALAALQEDVDLLSSFTGVGAILLSNLETTVGDREDGSLRNLATRLETIQQNLGVLSEMDLTQTDFSDETAVLSRIESDLDDLDALITDFRQTDSTVLVKPFVEETLSVINVNIDPTHFYVPAVIALLLQHIAITIAGLSIVRERKEGAIEFFQAAPVSPFETLLGKYLSFLLLIGALAAILVALIIWGLGVPMLGAPDRFIAAIAALLTVSLGIGFHISLSAQSNSQAIQFSMIVLLASIFFSGFFLPLYRLRPLARIISWAIPATYGTQLLQNIMLRGQTGSLLQQMLLILFSIILFALAWVRLRRQMKQE
jgi:ABC-2 type transport system permease protein